MSALLDRERNKTRFARALGIWLVGILKNEK